MKELNVWLVMELLEIFSLATCLQQRLSCWVWHVSLLIILFFWLHYLFVWRFLKVDKEFCFSSKLISVFAVKMFLKVCCKIYQVPLFALVTSRSTRFHCLFWQHFVKGNNELAVIYTTKIWDELIGYFKCFFYQWVHSRL